MTSLHFKKQICMEGGYMFDNMLIQVLMLIGGMFSIMLGFYILLCFIQWIADVVDEKRWYVWKEWIK